MTQAAVSVSHLGKQFAIGKPTGGGMLSATHGKADLDETVEAFRDAVMMLRREGLLPAT